MREENVVKEEDEENRKLMTFEDFPFIFFHLVICFYSYFLNFMVFFLIFNNLSTFFKIILPLYASVVLLIHKKLH